MTPDEREALANQFEDEDPPGEMYSDEAHGFGQGMTRAASIVRAHPAASPWIPVGEQLPERGEEVLCWCQVYWTLGDLNLDGEWENWKGMTIHPSLWMPIPIPESTP